jgi:hypothetical protein
VKRMWLLVIGYLIFSLRSLGWWCRPALHELAHFEPAGVDGRSFFFGASSGEGGLQMELGFLFTVKRGDVDSLQSPMSVLISGSMTRPCM